MSGAVFSSKCSKLKTATRYAYGGYSLIIFTVTGNRFVDKRCRSICMSIDIDQLGVISSDNPKIPGIQNMYQDMAHLSK